VVHAIKQDSWFNSRIPVIDDKKIAAKVKKDFEEWTSLKNLSQGTVTWR